MEISANFAFLEQEFPFAAESASYAELEEEIAKGREELEGILG